ncbi:MAG TPA: hypothetical protein VGG11_03365 [Xanthobacteraceae bacterium]
MDDLPADRRQPRPQRDQACVVLLLFFPPPQAAERCPICPSSRRDDCSYCSPIAERLIVSGGIWDAPR